MALRHHAHLGLVFVFSLLNQLCDAGNGLATPTLNELCPYNNYCTSNASMILKSARNIPCCTQCSCENDCWRRGDCCPDKDNPIARLPTEICRDTIVRRFIDKNGRNDTETILGIEEMKRYYIIDTCPDKETSEAVVEKCSGETQGSLDDFVWVTDSDTGRIYRNTFCAGCHGVTNFVFWDLSTDCSAVVNDASNFRSVKTLPNECRLLVSPPKDMKAMARMCLLPSVSHCNITGNWQTNMYDANIEEKCETFESPFIESSRFLPRVYRNPFCYLCNNSPLKVKADVCSDFRDLKHRGVGSEFLALLDHRVLREAPKEKVKAERCAIDEVYEPIQGQCKTLFCPALQLASFGVCMSVSLQTHQLGIAVHYKLEPVLARSTPPTEDGSIYYTEEVATAIIGKMNVLDKYCIGSENTVYVAHEQRVRSEKPVYYKVTLKYLRDKTCQEDLIMRMGRIRENILIRMENGEVMELTVHFDEESTDDDDTIYELRSSDLVIKTYASFNDLIMCPKLVFKNTEYIDIMGRIRGTRREDAVNNVFSNGDNSSSETGESIISVCLSDYMAAVANKSASQYYGIHVIAFCLIMVGAF